MQGQNQRDIAFAYLQGLFRSASQLKQADFLARDFKQPKHQEAACKNAFVLLGQHKHELAAAFFILGTVFLATKTDWQEQHQPCNITIWLMRSSKPTKDYVSA